jgi:hypothetical protein
MILRMRKPGSIGPTNDDEINHEDAPSAHP